VHCPMQRENAELLLAYVERKLSAPGAEAFERHLEVCDACRESLAAQQAVWVALDHWDAAEISVDFNRRLYRKIESEQRQPWWRRIPAPALPWALRPAMPIAVAAMAMVAVFLFRGPSGTDLPRHRSADTVDVEQVERTLDDLDMLKQLGVAGQEEWKDSTAL
jgi:anti-sigma factor RsiW